MKLTLTLASAAYFALTLGACAESASSQTNGVPGGTISTPGPEQVQPNSASDQAG